MSRTATERIVLSLPNPPSKNELRRAAYKSEGYARMLRHQYKRKAWAVAQGQHAPTTDPPDPVLIKAHFRLHNLRDEDNLQLDLVLDALRCPRPGEKMGWRQGIAVKKGFFVDDGPDHMTLAPPTQEVDRANRGLTLQIIPLRRAESEAA